MKLAVIGSKEFKDYRKLKSVLDQLSGITAIVSGAASGTDAMAARYAKVHNIKLIEFPPDYKNYGEEAKHFRDRQIVENCDSLIAFWDGKCEGTKYTIEYAEKLEIPLKVISIQSSPLEGENPEIFREEGFSVK
ncbi:MAG: DUF2493 domain-containing protein [Candidatus Cloacimonetes bacterium]|nr:DUF2493 domain-containing protein [Candidatus Cloacimonadota bacterium]MCF7884177.1 DUF2493 domain-containing protein [Candidatus Cloacimonadota bacterium]